MLFGFIASNANNHGKSCANFQCQQKKVPPRATHYHTSDNSWICYSCASSVNRERLAMSRKYSGEYKPVAITAEEQLFRQLAKG